jgi:FkbM family methyltransferase
MFMNQSELLERHHLRPSGVLHVGASEGQEVETYLEAGISKQILVEALPSVFARLAARVEGISGVSAVNACISDVPAEGVAFNVADNDGQSSSLLDFGIHRDLHPDVHFVDRMEVNTVRIDQLSLDLTGIDYLVTDLQGCDLRAIRSTGRLLAQFDAVYSEVNLGQVYQGNDTIEEMDRYLSAHGFVRAETTWVTPHWGDAFYLRVSRGPLAIQR